MTFDWVGFLSARRIPFSGEGPNTAKGNVSVRCPWCVDDPSQHLGIALDGAGYHCWRNPRHSGRDPARLVAALLRCTLEQAIGLVGGRRAVPDSWLERCRDLLSAQEGPAKPLGRPLALPPEFTAFRPRESTTRLGRLFTAYLAERGFPDPAEFTERFGMYWAVTGRWHHRVIFTVTYGSFLVGWTGRTIGGHAVRYRAHTHDPDKAGKLKLAPAPAPINHYLWRWDRLLKPASDTLAVCEGPFDALALIVRGGIDATCLFGIAPTDRQVDLLHRLLPRYRRCYITPDRGAEHRGMETMSKLAGVGADIKFLPPGFADPGALTARAARNLFERR